MFGLAFLPAGLMAADAGLAAYESRETAYHQTIGASQLGAMAGSRDLVTRLRTATRTLSANAALYAHDKADCDRTLRNFAQEEPTIGMVAILRPNLSIVCSNIPETAGQSVAAAALIAAAAKADDVTAGFIAAPQTSQGPVLAAAAPAQMGNPKDLRFVYVSTPLRNVLALQRTPNDTRNQYTALVGADGRIFGLNNLALSSPEGQRLQQALTKTPPPQIQSAFAIDKTWAVITPLDKGKLYLLSGWQAASPTWLGLLKASWALIAPIALWAAAVTSVWLAIEVFVVRPLQVIEDLARAYARNEDTQAYETLLESAPSEIFSLRRSLAALARTLRGRELRLTDALAEQKTLLLEVHHRVKNNLQLITSLLSIQARASGPLEARVLNRANERIQLLSLAHNLIYNSAEVRGISLDRLAAEVSSALVSAHQARGKNLGLDTELAPVRASADLAVPFAFLLGETLSTLLDRAPAGLAEKTLIHISMQRTEASVQIELTERDNTNLAYLDASSQRIIAAFASQIGATVDFSSGANSTVMIEILATKLDSTRSSSANAAKAAPSVSLT